MKAPLIIFGAGGLGRELLSFIQQMEEYEVVAFLDDLVKEDTVVKGIPVLGGASYLKSIKTDVNVVLAFGDPTVKANIRRQIESPRVLFPVLIHPTAVLQDRSAIKIGEGSVICAGAVLTTEISIGKHVLINLNSTVGHDSTIGDYCSLMPGVNIAGEVNIGNETLIGAGVSILNKVVIGNRVTVGMGSVVIRDVENGMVVAGVPAKPIVAKHPPTLRS